MNLLIIQARMGSTRLPGKVLREIKGVPLLHLLVKRVNAAKLIDQLVVATTTNDEDDRIVDFCKKHNIACARGSDWDVLDRFYQTAIRFKADHLVRVTSDCPLHHHSVVDFAVSSFNEAKVDYFSNSNHEPDVLEDGFDVEVFTFKALETAAKQANLLSEREHVTPFIKNSGKHTCAWKKYNANYHYKLSVDTQEDFNAVEKIFEAFDTTEGFGMEDVMKLLSEQPELLEFNKNSVINAGFKKSIETDRKV